MGRWSRSEIESAFKRHEEVVVEIGKSWDWSRYADQFTKEHALGTFQGREQIRDWIVSTMNTFPGSEMPLFPTSWHSVDEDKGWTLGTASEDALAFAKNMNW